MKGTDTLICKTISKSAVQYSIYAQKALLFKIYLGLHQFG